MVEMNYQRPKIGNFMSYLVLFITKNGHEL